MRVLASFCRKIPFFLFGIGGLFDRFFVAFLCCRFFEPDGGLSGSVFRYSSVVLFLVSPKNDARCLIAVFLSLEFAFLGSFARWFSPG